MAAACLAVPACAADRSGLRVASPDLRDGAPLNERFTCTGDNAVPTIEWSNVPPAVAGWAVVVEDPDAPAGTFTHWLVTGLGPTARSVGSPLPPGAQAGLTSAGQAGYVGPCPPTGQRHRYRYRVHALRAPLTLEATTPVAEARRRVESLSIDAAELEVTYLVP